MDQAGNQNVQFDIQTEIVCKVMSIPRRHPYVDGSGVFNRRNVKRAVRERHSCDAETLPPSTRRTVNRDQYLTVVLIRHADDDDDVFDEDFHLRTLRQNWGLLFLNATACVKVTIYANRDSNKRGQQRSWEKGFIGQIYTERFQFTGVDRKIEQGFRDPSADRDTDRDTDSPSDESSDSDSEGERDNRGDISSDQGGDATNTGTTPDERAIDRVNDGDNRKISRAAVQTRERARQSTGDADELATEMKHLRMEDISQVYRRQLTCQQFVMKPGICPVCQENHFEK